MTMTLDPTSQAAAPVITQPLGVPTGMEMQPQAFDHNLSTRAILVSLSLSVWEARKREKKAEKTVSDAHKIGAGKVKAIKKLMPDVAVSYDNMCKAATAYRNAFYDMTLPWGEGGNPSDDSEDNKDDKERGWRLLPSEMFLEFSSRMNALASNLETCFELFIIDLPTLKAQAKTELNGLYNEADYPTEKHLRRKFKGKIKVKPVPTAGDLRVDLGQDVLEKMRQEITQSVESAAAVSMRGLWSRLHNSVVHMTARLKETECFCSSCKGRKAMSDKFNDSLVTNIQDILAILPKLNFTNDPNLTKMAEEAKALIVEPDKLRSDDTLKMDIATKAQKIQDQMAGFMGLMAPATEA